MNLAIFQEQYAAGTNAPTGTASAANPRVFNTTVINNILGCELDAGTGIITVQPGFYKIDADAASFGYLASQLSLESVSGSPFQADGLSLDGAIGQGAQMGFVSSVTGWLRADVTTTFAASHFLGNTFGGPPSLGNSAGSGRTTVAAMLTITSCE